MEAVLEPKSVELERQSDEFADQHQHHYIKKDREAVVLRTTAIRPVAQSARPACGEQHDQQAEADYKIGNAQPPLDAVVAARLSRIDRFIRPRYGFRCAHDPEVYLLSYRVCWRARRESAVSMRL